MLVWWTQERWQGSSWNAFSFVDSHSFVGIRQVGTPFPDIVERTLLPSLFCSIFDAVSCCTCLRAPSTSSCSSRSKRCCIRTVACFKIASCSEALQQSTQVSAFAVLYYLGECSWISLDNGHHSITQIQDNVNNIFLTERSNSITIGFSWANQHWLTVNTGGIPPWSMSPGWVRYFPGSVTKREMKKRWARKVPSLGMYAKVVKLSAKDQGVRSWENLLLQLSCHSSFCSKPSPPMTYSLILLVVSRCQKMVAVMRLSWQW